MNPPLSIWNELIQRPAQQKVNKTAIQEIFDEVQSRGDEALKDYSAKWDKVNREEIPVSQTELQDLANSVDDQLKAFIRQAIQNVKAFHSKQQTTTIPVETSPGVSCWRKAVPIESVGIYIPGGTAPLFSTTYMLGVPAKLAGCMRVVVCTPAQSNGQIDPSVAFVCQELGLDEVYAVGGAQAIAALTLGTESIKPVQKLFGPGNSWVTAAKEYAQTLGVAIDMPAGPSEVLIIADGNANPTFVAADLLSQAEHGEDSQVVLVSDSDQLLEAVEQEIQNQLQALPRQEIASKSLQNSLLILVNDLGVAMQFSNAYAPEHLILQVQNADDLAMKVVNAGSVFIGEFSCETAGDYASGTNHTLPTYGYARQYSGVSLDSFIRQITFQKVSEEGISQMGEMLERLAGAEGLDAHKNAVTVRLKAIGEKKYERSTPKPRFNVQQFKAYSSARDEFKGSADVWLDANENPFDSVYNRYPDPLQRELKRALSSMWNVETDQLFLGNGSDEAIDLLCRAYGEPNKDKILVTSPTYGMYHVSAALQGLEVLDVPLNLNFQLDVASIINVVQNERPAITFLCSPNNPTGNTLNEKDIETVLLASNGVVVIDEAYIDFADSKSWVEQLNQYPNLVVLRTFSKARGLAGIRLGAAIANPEIIDVLNRIKPPYNVNQLTQEKALDSILTNRSFEIQVQEIIAEREKLISFLSELEGVSKVYPSEANFILIKTPKAQEVYRKLTEIGIVIRDRSSQIPNALRITVGTPTENQQLMNTLKTLLS